jgi:hypothetical protein
MKMKGATKFNPTRVVKHLGKKGTQFYHAISNSTKKFPPKKVLPPNANAPDQTMRCPTRKVLKTGNGGS